MTHVTYDGSYGRHPNSKNPITEAEKEEWINQVLALSNEELLDDYTELAGGDDYDGCMTAGGDVVWAAVRAEFYRRLKEVGY